MADPKINGTLAPVNQPVEYQFDPQNGLRVLEKWESAGDGLRGLANAYSFARVGFNLIAGKHKSTLIATLSGPQSGQPEVTTDTWQIVANEIQKDLREHPKSAALGQATMDKVNSSVEANSMDSSLNGDAATLYQLLTAGTTHYALGQYVLRHTTNVSNTYNVNVSDANVERIYTTAQLIAEVTNGNSWAFPMPGRLVFKIQNLPAPTVKSGFLWGWRKLPSTETSSANNRIDITTEYWLEQWSTFIYSPAV